MAGSQAEERIRAKIEIALRREFPAARIVHELNMSQGGVRLDMAAVRPDGITLVEIKSERDVLKRLRDQITAALRITGDVRVYAAEKHRAALLDAGRSEQADADGKTIIDWVTEGSSRIGRSRKNPAYIAELRRARVMIEAGEGFEDLDRYQGVHWLRDVMEHMADPRAQLEMLWADELRELLARHRVGTTPRASREVNKRLALELLTGRQIRESVCASLRDRPFARADEVAA